MKDERNKISNWDTGRVTTEIHFRRTKYNFTTISRLYILNQLMDYKNYRGVVFGLPEKEDVPFNLEIARFREVGANGEHIADEKMENLRTAITDKRFFFYIGDLDEIFEFYLQSTSFNNDLVEQGLTFSSGEKHSFNNNSESQTDLQLWNHEIKQLVTHLKENYFNCSQEFLANNGFYKMYERYNLEYNALLDDPSNLNISLEEELDLTEKLKIKIELEVLSEKK